jgi:hypothetical protein
VNAYQILGLFGIVVAFADPAAAQQGVQIERATYGVQPSGPSCDATLALQHQCNGKESCQVYVDPRYLCPDPAYRQPKSVIVAYSCHGAADTKSFPDTAQLVLQCRSAGGGAVSITNPGTAGGGNLTGGSGPPQSRPFPSIAGRWIVSSSGSVGDLDISVNGTWITGNIYANLIPGGNSIEGTVNGARIEFDRHSVAHQHWSGAVDPSGNRISGIVTYPGGSQPWTATRR